MRFIHRDTVGSTQDEARALYQAGERGPLWLRADEQTSGRGRRGRDWVSKSGNLYTTGIIPFDGPPAKAAKLSFIAALALADTLAQYPLEDAVTLKWPNDVRIGGAKVAGILLENVGEAVLVGIGINLAHHPEGLPYPVTHVLAHISNEALSDPELAFSGPAPLLASVAHHFDNWLNRFLSDGFKPIAARWTELASGLGQIATINLASVSFDAELISLEDDGALRVRRTDGTIELIHAGDVMLPVSS